MYSGLLYSAQNIVKKDPGRAMQNSLATAQTNFTQPGAQIKGDLCTLYRSTEIRTAFHDDFFLSCRFIGVYALTFLINKRRVNRIGFKEQFIMAYGGLRGAVGFSLVVLIPALNPKQHQTLNDIFLLTTLIMIFFTVFVQGGTIKFLVSKLNITRKSEEGLSMAKDTNLITMDHVMAGVESVTGYHSQVKIWTD